MELFVGDARRDVAYLDPPATTTDFTLRSDTAGGKSGPATARIVACGGSPDGLALIQGCGIGAGKGAGLPRAGREQGADRHREQGVDPAPSSLVMGIVIAVPAVAGLLYAASTRRRRM